MKETTVPAYKWSKEVKKLDDNKCAYCGSTENLEAHHITPKAISPDEATDLENGITLCHRCHYTAHGANYTTSGLKAFGDRGFTTSPTIMKAFIEDYKNNTIVFCAPKEQMDSLKAQADKEGESVNAFINRAIMEVTEMDNMHRAYQRGLLHHLERANEALDNNDLAEAKKILTALIEDTKADI